MVKRDSKRKRPYQKPTLEGEKMLEVSGQVCCRTKALSCTAAGRDGKKKSAKNTVTS